MKRFAAAFATIIFAGVLIAKSTTSFFCCAEDPPCPEVLCLVTPQQTSPAP